MFCSTRSGSPIVPGTVVSSALVSVSFVSSGCSAARAHARLVEAARALAARSSSTRPAVGPASSAAVKSRTQDSCAVSETTTRSAARVADADLEAAVVVGRADHLGRAVGRRPMPPRGESRRRRRRRSARACRARGSARARRRVRAPAAAAGGASAAASAGAASGPVGVGRCAAVGSFGRVSHLGLEMDRVRDANRRGLAVDLGGEELHLARRGDGRLVEAVAGRRRDGHRGHVPVRGDIDRQGDVAADARRPAPRAGRPARPAS